MRKIFTLFAAMLLSFAAFATEKPVNPGTDALIAALATAENGDVFVLADGTYNEYSNYIVLQNNIEIKAAENAHPVVNVGCYVKVQGDASVKVQGITFSGAEQGHNGSSYSHFIRIYSMNSLEFVDCEFCNIDDQIIEVEATATSHIGALKFNGCYFHDATNSAIYVAKSTTANACDTLHIANSTFANFSGFSNALIEIFNVGETKTPDVELRVDHCTFYNYKKTSNNTYGFIDCRKSTNVAVSNCVFMNPLPLPEGEANPKATQLYGGTVSNCLNFQTSNHRGDDITASNNIVGQDPLFVDAENANYTLGEGSPALGAGTDGSNLGDPRWWPAAAPIEYRTIYCKLNAGWWIYDSNGQPTNKVAAHAWGEGVAGTEWPGLTMSLVEGESNVWAVELDTRYTGVVFTRVNQDGGYESIKTVDLVIPAYDSAMYVINKETYDWSQYVEVISASEGEWSVFTPTQTVTLADGYYLMGKINGVAPAGDWDVSAINPEYILTQNPANTAEYMITVTLAENDEFQVVGVENGAIGPWLPGGENANYQVDANHAGLKTIYCRPDRGGAADWWKNCIYVAPNESTDLEAIQGDAKATKFMRNGRLYIIRNGIRYNALGQQE